MRMAARIPFLPEAQVRILEEPTVLDSQTLPPPSKPARADPMLLSPPPCLPPPPVRTPGMTLDLSE